MPVPGETRTSKSGDLGQCVQTKVVLKLVIGTSIVANRARPRKDWGDIFDRLKYYVTTFTYLCVDDFSKNVLLNAPTCVENIETQI